MVVGGAGSFSNGADGCSAVCAAAADAPRAAAAVVVLALPVARWRLPAGAAGRKGQEGRDRDAHP